MFNLEASGLVGIITAGLVEVLKRLPQVPLIAGQTAHIRAVAAVFSFLGNFGVALSDGNVDGMKLAANTVASFFVAFLTYKGVIKDTRLETKR